MKLTVDVKNGDSYEVEVAEDAIYAEVLERVGFNPEGAVAIVDGRPVPEDKEVGEDMKDVSEIQVMRTVSGG